MLSALTLIASSFVQVPTVLTPHVVSVTIFKPGLAYVTRDVIVPGGSGFYALDRVPRAIDGTFWYGSPDGAAVSEMQTGLDLSATEKPREATSIPEILATNIGKTVTVTFKDEKANQTLSGKLIGYKPAENTMTLRLANGHMRSLPPSSVVDVDLAGLKTSFAPSAPKVSLRFRTDAKKESRIRFTDLETGAAWVANYNLDLGAVTSHLKSMAEVGLGALNLSYTEVKLATGLPLMDSVTKLDLGTGSTSLKGFLDGQPPLELGGPVDPYEVLIERMQHPVLQGGTGLVPKGIDFISYDPSDNSLVVKNEADLPQFLARAISASRLEDIQVYPFGMVSLPAGGRIMRTLSETNLTAKAVYRWSVSPQNTATNVTNTIRLKNDTPHPWPAGSVFVTTFEVPLARLTMPMTPSGQEATLEWGSVEDFPHEYSNEVVERKAVVLSSGLKVVEVTNETTLTITNTRNSFVNAEIVFNVNGEVLTAAEGKTSMKRMRNAFNPESTVQWEVALEPGVERKFVCRYKEMVR